MPGTSAQLANATRNDRKHHNRNSRKSNVSITNDTPINTSTPNNTQDVSESAEELSESQILYEGLWADETFQIDSIDDPAFIPENDENSTNDDTLELDFSTSDIAERDRNRELEELLQAWSITSMEMSNRNS